MLLARTAMNHDLVRGMKGGQPFCLMEQTPSVINWLPYNAPKRLGGMGFLIWQAVTHGGDSVLFFQMRRSIGVCEKCHGALMDHAGHEHIWVSREMQVLGAQLAILSGVALGARTAAKAIIVVDWGNWQALEYSVGPSRELKYLDKVKQYYQPFFELNIPVDTVSAEDDLEEYKTAVAKDQVISGVMHAIQNMYNPRLFVFVEV